jgi:DNA topoisomerase-1
MAKNLLIVESPAKAKTIEKILGSDFEVKSCYGHIRDLEKDAMGIDVKKGFKPRYIVSEEKEKVVKELKQLAKKSGEVWLATDEDREGEAISWHLCEVLGLDPSSTKRIVFHEITKPAIKSAVDKPRTVDMNLVNAQQARRILDRIVGFELSPILWRKMSMRGNLSAGRVQSVAVRLIVERERDINSFNSISSFKIDAFFEAKDINGKVIIFKAEGRKKNTVEEAEKFLESCIGATFNVEDVQKKPAKKSPAAPFTTSTLQQEASRKLGYGVSKTMLLAQKLYEAGHISYMRTDSVNLSDTALEDISKQITGNYGAQYLQNRKFKNKNESAQEAHEAIRPTYMEKQVVDIVDAQRLYDLIWKRTMASQMADAELEKTTADISISTNNEKLTAQGEVMKFDGFLKVYNEGKDEEEETDDAANEGMLPPLTIGQKLVLSEMVTTERFSRPLPRYTEASLVKKLEELGIGRPSTYAPTISTVLKRGYVEKRDKEGVKRNYKVVKLKNDTISKSIEQENTGAEKSKLFPTDLGSVINDFLIQHFDNVMDFGFTAKIESEFDEIAEGRVDWSKMLKNFYEPFKKEVDETMETAERISGERELGIDPITGKKVITRMGKYGPMVQLGDTTDTEDKAKFAKLKTDQSIETITFEEAMELFKLPRILGEFEGEPVQVSIGRFGPYIAHNKLFYSLPKENDPYQIKLEEAIPIIEEKRTAKNERTIKIFEKEKIQLLKGPYGPYIKKGLRNFPIPKEKQENAQDLEIEEVQQMIEYAIANPSKRKGRAKKS